MTLFAELKRRNVFRVGAAYVVVSWLILQVVDVVAPILEFPEWVAKGILLIIVIGFIPALLLAWAFELTPQGVKREQDVDRSDSTTRKTGQKLNRIIIGLLALIILMMGAERAGLFQTGSLEPPAELAKSVSPSPADPAVATRPRLDPADKSIAVLPFTNRSQGSENTRFFSDGIHDDLLTQLSKIHELKVISRTSVMAYRETTKNMRQIGEELGVSNLLEGGIQQAGDRVRINMQLINAKTDEHLWAESWDRTVTAENLFEIQSEVARAIANALQATLTEEENEELGRTPTTNTDAYQAILMARQLVRRNGFNALSRAEEYARKAIALDPEYIDAYLSLVVALTEGVYLGKYDAADIDAEAREALDKAFEIDPLYGRAWSSLGVLRSLLGEPGAEQAFERALQLDPGNSDTMNVYANVLQRDGKPQKALPILQQARELDPLSPTILFVLGRTLGALEDYEGALGAFARIREIDPSSPLGYGPVGGSYYALGRLDQSVFWIRRALEMDPEDYELAGWMVFILDTLEDFTGAREWSDWLNDWVTNEPQPMAMQAHHHYLVGNFGIALQYANLALNLGLPDRWNSDGVYMRIKRDEALANGAPTAGIEVFRKHHPQLFGEQPLITRNNLLQAVDLALLLKLAGREQDAQRLLEAALEAYDRPYFTTGGAKAWLVPAKAEALAILGRDREALDELRRIIDKGWRIYWRWETDLNPNFNGLHNHPEFQAMIEELEKDMRQQREQVFEMNNQGKIAPLPEP
jgi:TolB-like protein/tetratricopeptide (TPR) repeat protein